MHVSISYGARLPLHTVQELSPFSQMMSLATSNIWASCALQGLIPEPSTHGSSAHAHTVCKPPWSPAERTRAHNGIAKGHMSFHTGCHSESSFPIILSFHKRWTPPSALSFTSLHLG